MTDMTIAKTGTSKELPKTGKLAVTRRDLIAVVVGTGVVLALPMASGCAHSDWADVGKTTDFTVGQPKRVVLADSSVVFVTRTSETAVAAVSAKCTHKGCEVAWNPGNQQLACPCHGAAFQSDGKSIHGTKFNPSEVLPSLGSVSARIQDGSVQVNAKGTA